MKKFAFAAALVASAVSAQAADRFVNIYSGNAMAQGAGLVLAAQALEQKANVRVLLCDAAADIAVAGKDTPSLKPRNVTPQLIKNNYQVIDHLCSVVANHAFAHPKAPISTQPKPAMGWPHCTRYPKSEKNRSHQSKSIPLNEIFLLLLRA